MATRGLMPKIDTMLRPVASLLALAAVSGSLAGQAPATHRAHALTARQVVLELKAQGLPIGALQVYSAKSDPNHLLGRPGQYTSKVNFRDKRLARAPDFDVEGGGSVEVFKTAADARRRYAYVHAITQVSSMFVEYEYLKGRIFLRLSKELTPKQARQYKNAFKGL